MNKQMTQSAQQNIEMRKIEEEILDSISQKAADREASKVWYSSDPIQRKKTYAYTVLNKHLK